MYIRICTYNIGVGRYNYVYMYNFYIVCECPIQMTIRNVWCSRMFVECLDHGREGTHTYVRVSEYWNVQCNGGCLMRIWLLYIL